jgi:hypothetical protein
MTAELDPLRGEGERYARLLNLAGTKATVRRRPGAIHATTYLTRVWRPAREWQRDAAAAVRSALWKPTAPSKDSVSRKDGDTGTVPAPAVPPAVNVTNKV